MDNDGSNLLSSHRAIKNPLALLDQYHDTLALVATLLQAKLRLTSQQCKGPEV